MSKVDKAIKDKRSNLTISLKNTVQFFNIYDDIIRESLLRKAKIILKNEFFSKASKIENTTISRSNNDIILEVHSA